MSKLLLNGVLLVSLLSSGILFAKDGNKNGEDRFYKRFGIKSVDLTDEQKEKIKEIQKKYKDLMPKLNESLKESKEALKKGFESDMGEAELKKLHTELEKKKEELQALRFDHVLNLRTILTPEQRKKLKDTFFKEHKENSMNKGKNKKRFNKNRSEDQ